MTSKHIRNLLKYLTSVSVLHSFFRTDSKSLIIVIVDLLVNTIFLPGIFLIELSAHQDRKSGKESLWIFDGNNLN